MEPVEYLNVLRRRWRLIAAIVAIGLAAAWLTTPQRSTRAPSDTVYRATVTLLLDPLKPTTTLNLKRTAVFVTAGEVPGRVAERLGQPSASAALAQQVNAVADPEIGMIQITSTQRTREEAIRVPTVFAEELLRLIEEQEQQAIDSQVALATTKIAALEAEIAALDRAVAADPGDQVLEERRRALIRELGFADQRMLQLTDQETGGSPLLLLDEPAVSAISSGGFQPPESRSGRMILAAGLALALGAALAFVVDRLDIRIRGRQDAEEAFGLPVIAELPASARHLRRTDAVVTMTLPHSTRANAYRALRTSLLFLMSDGRANGNGNGNGTGDNPPADLPLGVVVVTSPSGSEGKSTTVANLAAAFAESGRTVLVADFDFRRPRAHRFLGVDNGLGVSDILAGRAKPEVVRTAARETTIPGVRLLPSGTMSAPPGNVLDPARRLLAIARRIADVVIVDTSPVLVLNDAAELVPAADAMLLVARIGTTTTEAATQTAERMRRLGASVAGVVLVGSGTPRPYHREPVDRLTRLGAGVTTLVRRAEQRLAHAKNGHAGADRSGAPAEEGSER